MTKSLVIVESPAKARTIGTFLNSEEFVVESSVGHVRDLPSKKNELPDAYRSEPWAYLGIDVDNGFKPVYVSKGRAQEQVKHLKQVVKQGKFDLLYLATDEDREGEAIAWHLLEVLKPVLGDTTVRRMVFHEITESAIRAAVDEPREIDMRLVDAQEARRCFDRLYGYEMSPVLWRKVRRGLSAGRVQSVANRLIVERERERIAFVSADFHSVAVELQPADQAAKPFEAALRSVDGTRVAEGGDFNDRGEVESDDEVVVLEGKVANHIAEAAKGATFTVSSRQSRPYRSRPQAPFITSSLQRAAASALRFSAQRTMAAAQRLYEAGRITYMRTDSVTLSASAVGTARAVAAKRFGEANVPNTPRSYKGKARNAQEAHEAIRPAGDNWAAPGSVTDLGGDAAALYDLIWRRTVASQMNDAEGETVSIRLTGPAGGHELELATGGTVLTSPGYRLVDQEARAGRARDAKSAAGDAGAEQADGAGAGDADGDGAAELPDIAEGDQCVGINGTANGHSTNPPRRYTEASLVAKLEELGIGRPSTYASILGTIVDRGYITKRGSTLVPEWVAMVTVGLMEAHYPSLVDYELTARMEDDLDQIAGGQQEMARWLASFYFGPDGDWPGLRQVVSDDFLAEIDAKAVNGIPLGVDSEGRGIEVRAGRFGPYVRRSDDENRSVPDGLAPDELTIDLAVDLFNKPQEQVLGQDPETGLDIIVRSGRFGPYVSRGRPDDPALEGEKPKNASLLSGWDPATVTLDQALAVLSLPRVVGDHPSGEGVITATNGRFGPYISWARPGTDEDGKAFKPDNRNLDSEEQMFSITLEQAVDLLAQPKRRRGQSSAGPLRELGEDPNSNKPIVLRNGRFGPYVSDGETNASLGNRYTVEAITLEDAIEALVARRAKGPAKKATKPKKPAAKKPAAKKPATKKPPAKKTTSKKQG